MLHRKGLSAESRTWNSIMTDLIASLFSTSRSFLMVLIAYLLPVDGSSARNTRPNAPTPSKCVTLKLLSATSSSPIFFRSIYDWPDISNYTVIIGFAFATLLGAIFLYIIVVPPAPLFTAGLTGSLVSSSFFSSSAAKFALFYDWAASYYAYAGSF